MSVAKRFVVLANSVKHAPGRCVAGRELLRGANGTNRLGGWLRPVSLVGEGELLAQHCQIEGRGAIKLLDVFDVSLDGPSNDPSQPENWIIDSHTPWKRVGTWPPNRRSDFYENPDDLWIEPNVKTDRVSPQFLARHPPQQSLYVIPLSNPMITKDHWDPRRHRLQFSHGAAWYALKITDPLLHTEADGSGPVAACISLAPPYEGFHYKLIASLFW
jgi:hypothetical protein